MKIEVIRNALGALDGSINAIRDAVRDIEADLFDDQQRSRTYQYEEPKDVLEEQLERIGQILLVVLEAAEMPDTRRQFEVEWARLAAPKGAFRRTVNNPEYSSTSPALTFIERVIHGLRISSGEGSLSSPDAYRLGRLESLLRETAVHVRNRGVTPSNEHDVQRVMHDYLRAFFPDFSLNPSIAGSIKKFTPDCGIRGLKAAIEFKIVHSERDVPRGFSGVGRRHRRVQGF